MTRKLFRAVMLFGLLAGAVMATSVSALTVTSTTSIALEFDLGQSGSGDDGDFVSRLFTTCYPTCSSDPADGGRLAVGASLDFALGTAPGLDDLISTIRFTNPAGTSIQGFGPSVLRLIDWGGSTSATSAFMTLSFVDDEVFVDTSGSLSTIGPVATGLGIGSPTWKWIPSIAVHEVPVGGQVPLPGALWLMLGGIGALGLNPRRRKHRS